jgi:hypothetical protein
MKWAVAVAELTNRNNHSYFVGFEVLTAVSTKMAVFWVVTPCSLIALMMEAARTSETLINFYQTTRRYNPEDSHLPFIPCCSILKRIWNCILLREIMCKLIELFPPHVIK